MEYETTEGWLRERVRETQERAVRDTWHREHPGWLELNRKPSSTWDAPRESCDQSD